MNNNAFTPKVADRITRACTPIVVMAIAVVTVTKEGSKSTTITKANIRAGNASKVSTKRCTDKSTSPPA